VQTFTLEEIDRIAVELGPIYGNMVRFAAATGMRPEEWVAIERQDVDRTAGIVRVVRTHVEGRTKTYGKTSGSVREVTLSSRALDALDSMPARLDTRLCSPAHAEPTSTSATCAVANGTRHSRRPVVPPRRIYDLRSTFASQALAAGVSVFDLGKIMGTSVRMIERHYGALLQVPATRSAESWTPT